MANGESRNPSSYTASSGQDGSAGGSLPNTRTPGATDNAWGSFNGRGSAGFSDQPTLGGGFGDSGDDQSNRPPHQPSRSVSGAITIPPGTGEFVTVTLLPDKEGMFLFQHHNYEVKTIRKGNSVVRRYSDFVWLLDCLQKRYPFRRLPLLPPKRVQGMITPANGPIVLTSGSQWNTPRRRRVRLPGEAKKRARSVFQPAGPASNLEPGTARSDVPERSHGRSLSKSWPLLD
jgi:PX domain